MVARSFPISLNGNNKAKVAGSIPAMGSVFLSLQKVFLDLNYANSFALVVVGQ